MLQFQLVARVQLQGESGVPFGAEAEVEALDANEPPHRIRLAISRFEIDENAARLAMTGRSSVWVDAGKQGYRLEPGGSDLTYVGTWMGLNPSSGSPGLRQPP